MFSTYAAGITTHFWHVRHKTPSDAHLRLTSIGGTVAGTRDYAIGADTAEGDVAVTLPDMGTNFTSVFIRKFSGANALTIWSGTVLLDTLSADGASRAYDWWPDQTNWYGRN